MSQSHKGKTFSDRHKKKIAQSKTGKANPMFGRNGIKSPAKKFQPFKMIGVCSGEVFAFNYIFEAVERLEVCPNNLSAVLHGRRKTVNGFRAYFLHSVHVDSFNSSGTVDPVQS